MQKSGRNNDRKNEEEVEQLEGYARAAKEYAVDGILSQVGKDANVKYVIRWYGFT